MVTETPGLDQAGSMNSFGARFALTVDDQKLEIYRLDTLESPGRRMALLPYSIRILLENLLRWEDGLTVTKNDVEALADWNPGQNREIAFRPARTLLQDFTGVPALVDLAAMRDAMAALGGDPARINPLHPVDLVIDHSIQVDSSGAANAMERNGALDYVRNAERYAFLRWGQRAFAKLRVVPPNSGIVHQVNLEYLAQVVFSAGGLAYPDTCVGTDSHTPMVNGLGVLAWGVGGIEAEAAMLGQPISMLIPEVVGVRLEGALGEGVSATDLVLTITEMLRKKGVVGKFVEFCGPGLSTLSLANRATIANMAPEYGATVAYFPPDATTLNYLRFTGRKKEQLTLVEAYLKEQGLFREDEAPEPRFTEMLRLELASVEPSVAGPGRPQDRIPLSRLKQRFREHLPELRPSREEAPSGSLPDGSVVIAAITSCTNTSNPEVMLAAGLLAKKAVERGLSTRPWVKASLAPGSKVVTRYLEEAGLSPYLDKLGFQLVGYGCTTCIGNSGPLLPDVSQEIGERVAAAVLSGNRNFEGRIHPEVRANFLMSPPLVVSFALIGRIDWDPTEPLGTDPEGRAVFLRDIWPSSAEIEQAAACALRPEVYRQVYDSIFAGDSRWHGLPVPDGQLYPWKEASTYVRKPPYFEKFARKAPEVQDIGGARVVAFLGDSVTTDHISPAGGIPESTPAARYLRAQGVKELNSYGSRRGNHEVMVRGTFASLRIRNRLVPGVEGGTTLFQPTGELTSIYEAALRYQQQGIPLCVIAGKEYGSGSSRDWAAKGPALQGVRFVIAESFERIHRSNLVGMGVLPLQFLPGESAKSLGLNGRETFRLLGLKTALESRFSDGRELQVQAVLEDRKTGFSVTVRIDTPQELLYYLHGGILPYQLRQLLGEAPRELPGGLPPRPPSDATAPDNLVEEQSRESFPASDAPAY
jgi:aconitate hydratase